MRFLANENFPLDAVMSLREAGHNVAWVRSDAPGLGDAAVLVWAMREERILLTFDKDFAELAFGARLPASCGILLFRLTMPSPNAVGRLLAARIAERTDWAGHFKVVESGRVRMRALHTVT